MRRCISEGRMRMFCPLSIRTLSSNSCAMRPRECFGIKEYYEKSIAINEKLQGLLKDVNTYMSELYVDHIPLKKDDQTIKVELSSAKPDGIPMSLKYKENVNWSESNILSSKIGKCKSEMLDLFNELESLELLKQRHISN